MSQKTTSRFLRILTWSAAAITAAAVIFLLAHILIKGIPHLSPELFAWNYTTENQSMLPAIINTVLMTFATLLISVPLGVCTAIYLSEYAQRGSRLVKLIRITAETLSGIPSIIYGLFGFLMFVVGLKWQYSFLAGTLTLAIMVLPLIIRTTEEALIAVPDSYREGSFGLGAGRMRTVFRIILPAAMPGILSGVILSIGRIFGESAALIFTSGSAAKIVSGLFSSGRTLAVHMYCLLSEGLYTNQAYATAVVLLVLVLGINFLSTRMVNKLNKE